MSKRDKLVDIIPSSIQRAPSVDAVARSIDFGFERMQDEIPKSLHYPRLRELPSAVLDLLAWQFHVDFYDQALDVDTKRRLLLQSIAWHRIKGTPAAVESMVEAVYASGVVKEWYEYGGEPYHFKVVVRSEPIRDEETLKRLRRAIEEVKNVRSWMDPFEFEQALSKQIFVGGVVTVEKEMVIHA